LRCRAAVRFEGIWRCGKGAPGQSAALRCGGRRCASTPLRPGPEARALARHKQSSGLFVSGLRASNPRPRRATRSAPCGRCAQTGAPSLMTKRAARAGHGSCASRHRIGAPQPARVRPCGTGGDMPREQPPQRGSDAHSVAATTFRGLRVGRWRGAWCGAEERRACGPRAQRATCSDSSRVSERSERQFAQRVPRRGRKTEHRREPRPQVGASHSKPRQRPTRSPAPSDEPMAQRDEDERQQCARSSRAACMLWSHRAEAPPSAPRRRPMDTRKPPWRTQVCTISRE